MSVVYLLLIFIGVELTLFFGFFGALAVRDWWRGRGLHPFPPQPAPAKSVEDQLYDQDVDAEFFRLVRGLDTAS